MAYILQLCVLGCALLASVSAQRDCFVDLVFVMDRSGSIDRDTPNGRRQNIDLIQQFLSTMVAGFNIGRDNAQIGLISFSSTANVDLQFSQSRSVINEKLKIENIRALFGGGMTATQAALVLARRMFEGSEDRPDAPNVVFLLTDGQPSEGLNGNLLGEAENLKDEQVRIIGLGVTTSVGPSLDDIADITFSIANFDNLTDVREAIGKAICPVQPVPDPVCEAPQDGIAFSAYTNAGSMRYMNGDRVEFGGTYLNRGGRYDTRNNEFICPCRGVYTFTHMMSGLNFAIATVIKKNGEQQSPLAYVISDGMMSTETIISCEEGERVYVEVVMSSSAGFVPCNFEGIPLAGFTGRLDFYY